MIEIDCGWACERDLWRAYAEGAGKLLEAFESGISLEVKSEALVVEDSIDRGRSVCRRAEDQSSARP